MGTIWEMVRPFGDLLIWSFDDAMSNCEISRLDGMHAWQIGSTELLPRAVVTVGNHACKAAGIHHPHVASTWQGSHS